MSTLMQTPIGAETRPDRCGFAAENVTRSLLGWLAVAGPFYVIVSLIQALTRPGFDLAHQEWSLLALGRYGWLQQTNFTLTGTMVIVGAIGLRRSLSRTAAGGTWAPRLLAGYGLGLIGAGTFRADAADGFPVGTPAGPATHVSWHGNLHIIFGSFGFACLIAVSFVFARHYALRSQSRAAGTARIVGLVFTIGFAGIASGSANPTVTIAFTVAVILTSVWLTTVAVGVYRHIGAADTAGREPVAHPSHIDRGQR